MLPQLQSDVVRYVCEPHRIRHNPWGRLSKARAIIPLPQHRAVRERDVLGAEEMLRILVLAALQGRLRKPPCKACRPGVQIEHNDETLVRVEDEARAVY